MSLKKKIKQGPDRVDVLSIEKTDNTFPKLTGGYITKTDKRTGGDPVAWTMPTTTGVPAEFIHELPKPENVTPAQNLYIKSEFDKLSNSVIFRDASFETGYPSVIDITSFVDFMIINELSANADAYQFSTYYHKDRNGKLRAGPIWDLNLTYGYDLAIWGFDRSKTDTWQFANGDNEGPQFWHGLFNSPEFRCALSKRWNHLIQPGQPLNYSVIESLIDQTVEHISEATFREYSRWGTVPDFLGEIAKIKDFLKARIPWMTAAIGKPSGCGEVEIPSLVITKIMYNPDTSPGFPDANDQEFIEITNTGSDIVDLSGIYFRGTGFVYQFPPYTIMSPGTSKVIASKMPVFIAKYGFAAFGQFTRNLASKGESLVLVDGYGNVIDSVSYSNQPPWPDADGNGYFLELADLFSDNSLAASWIASNNTLVSVEDVAENNQELKLYPSPVTDNLRIESQGIINTLQLFDSQGRLLKTINVNSAIMYH